MTKKILKEGLGWGFVLWLIGYILGILLFKAVPNEVLGWVIMPIGTLVTLLVLWKKVHANFIGYYFVIGIVWTIIAIVCDYLFLVKLFNATTYYKFDVYVYYVLTFALPVVFGWIKTRNKKEKIQ